MTYLFVRGEGYGFVGLDLVALKRVDDQRNWLASCEERRIES